MAISFTLFQTKLFRINRN
uniref:Uncharacterized protein n=1 Tax=Anguilla anguilla TaxID=7936 RepID=A0A0E9PMQ5_ANGAN